MGRVENKGPTLYARCIYSKKNESVETIFYDEDNKKRGNPLSVLGKHFFTRFALKIESIYIGTKISLQFKLQEVGFRLKESSMKSLLFPELNNEGSVKFDEPASSEGLEYLSSNDFVEEEPYEEPESGLVEEDIEDDIEEDEMEEEDVEEEVMEEEELEEEVEEETVEEPVKPTRGKITKTAIPVVPVPEK